MAPKRSKSAQVGSSSQPLSESNRPARTSGRKRRFSDASNVSDSASTIAAAPPQKRKRTKVVKQAEVILEEPVEHEQMNDASEELELRCGSSTEPTEPHTTNDNLDRHGHRREHDELRTTYKQVQFATSHVEDEISTATNITPHPRKMSVKRRATLSPSENPAYLTKRIKTTSSIRASLPASLGPLSQDDERDTATIVQELQFAPLRSVLSERIRRRLRRSGLSEQQNALEHRDRRDLRALEQLEAKEAKLREVALELETQRQFAMDVSDETASEHEKLKALEREVRLLKEEVRELNAAHLDEDRHTPDGDMLVLDCQEQIAYPQLPTPNDSQALVPRQNTAGGAEEDDSPRSSQTRTSTRQSIGATANWEAERRNFEDAIVVLSREANDAKAELQILQIELGALGFDGEDASARDVLQSIRDAFARVRDELDITLPEDVDVDVPNSEILDIIVRSVKDFAAQLRQQELDAQDKGKLITDLSSQIQGLLDHLAEAEIRKHNLEEQWAALDMSNETKARELEDLEEELQATQTERDNLQAELDARIQEVNALGDENGNMVKNLEKLTASLESYRKEESRLSELIIKMEEEHREDVTKMNREREQTVQDLEARLDKETGLRTASEQQSEQRQELIDTLQERIQSLTAERNGVSTELETTQDTLETERSAREDLEVRLDNLEQELADVNEEIAELRQLNEAERNQRESAEKELDGLHNKLQQQGIEANQLRQKLFEAQQSHDQKFKEMQDLMSDRDDQFQADFAAEVGRREDLEARLKELENEMRGSIAERDERIGELEGQLSDREEEIVALKQDLDRAEHERTTTINERDNRIDGLQNSIDSLQATIFEHEETTATFGAEVAEVKTIVSDLQAEKAGLERRVEEEAEQMLQLQNDKEDEIEALKQAIHDKQQKILIVEEKAVEADRSWQEVLNARNEEITSLQATTSDTNATNEMLKKECASIKKRFQLYIERTSGAIDRLQAALLAAKTVADDEGDDLKAEGEGLFQELEMINGIEKVSSQKTTKTRNKKKRYADSGIGLEEEDSLMIN